MGILFVGLHHTPTTLSMKTIFFGIPLIFFCWNVQAQSFDDIIARNKYIDCKDVSYNAPGLIHTLYGKGETDSLYQFLDYWQNKCGNIEYIGSIRILLDIKTANFDSSAVTDELFTSLIRYKENDQMFDYVMYRNEVGQLYRNLQQETRNIASDIQQTYSVDEALLTDFLKSDTVTFNDIKKSSAHESKLKRLYDQKLTEALKMRQIHWAVFVSYYQPFGKLDVFGQHAGIGGMFGVNQLHHTLDFVMDIRFGRSANEYQFVYNGNLLKDNKWTSAYLGLEYTYDFYTSKKFKFGISPGVAYNGITAVPADDDDEDPKILPGLDVNGGLSFKYTFGKRGGYAGLQTRYHWVDHHNPGGTELTGSYLSVRLIFGSLFNYQRDYRLSQLDY